MSAAPAEPAAVPTAPACEPAPARAVPTREQITGLVLAGGRGARMGGLDKGLQAFHGVPLAQHALQRLRPQVGPLAISAHRNLDAYSALGVPVWQDELPGHAGPLAGFLAALTHCGTPWLLTVPCDTPNFPTDLARRLAEAAAASGADIAMASAPEPQADGAVPKLRPQPVFSLMRRSLRDDLLRFIQAGGRKVGAWAAQHRTVQVCFDQPQAFFNANTLDELRALERTPP